MPINMCNVLNIFDMPRYLHATLYIYVQYFHISVCDVQIYMFHVWIYMFNVRIYMFDVRGIFVFYVFRLYSMSSGYIQCLPENGIMGNLKAAETTALIGWLLFNMAAPQEHMEDNLLVDFLRLKRSQPIRAVVSEAFKLPIIPFPGRHYVNLADLDYRHVRREVLDVVAGPTLLLSHEPRLNPQLFIYLFIY